MKRVYGELSGNMNHGLDPKEIGAIAKGEMPGDKNAAIGAFEKCGEVIGDAMATAVTLTDGLIVIGGGVMHNRDFIMPGILKVMRSKMHQLTGEEFAKGDARKIKVYGSEEEVTYDPQKRTGVMCSKIGASKAISLGAYAFALEQLEK